MTADEYRREQTYRVMMSLMQSLKERGVIDGLDYDKADAIMTEKFHPILAGIRPKQA